MQDQRPRPGVVEQVAQLLADVAVVDVERAPPGPGTSPASPRGTRCRCRGPGRRGPAPTRGPGARPARGAARRPLPVQVGGQAPRALGHLGVGEAAVAPHDALPVGQGLDQGVEGLGQVELDGVGRAGGWGTAPHCTGGPVHPVGRRCGERGRHRQRSLRGRPQPRHRRGDRQGRGPRRAEETDAAIARAAAAFETWRAVAPGRPGPPAPALRRRGGRPPRRAGRARGGQRRPRDRERPLGGGQRPRRARVLRRARPSATAGGRSRCRAASTSPSTSRSAWSA